MMHVPALHNMANAVAASWRIVIDRDDTRRARAAVLLSLDIYYFSSSASSS